MESEAPSARRPKLRIRRAAATGESDGAAAVDAEAAMEARLNADAQFQADAAALPANYNFELARTVARLRALSARRVALQFPEGFLAYSGVIADVLRRWAAVDDAVVLGDVTYGACCVDDYTAQRLGADVLVHYGHSCLVPVGDVLSSGGVRTLYVFVDITFDVAHAAETVGRLLNPQRRVALFATIQFAAALPTLVALLRDRYHFQALTVPQAAPLSRGELLGCTAPTLPPGSYDDVLYVGDGRFHLEAAMIANAAPCAYRYDPYSKVLSEERYDLPRMLRTRSAAVAEARRRLFPRASAEDSPDGDGGQPLCGVVHGSLGRQGNPALVARMEQMLDARGVPHFTVLMSELAPARLALLADVAVWIQVACPRLSIDWGEQYCAPLLNPYEATLLLERPPPAAEESAEIVLDSYPMDYYAKDGGSWTNYFQPVPALSRPNVSADLFYFFTYFFFFFFYVFALAVNFFFF
jgi:2-(3-amino-3-carboxypropyl)histidine synthase